MGPELEFEKLRDWVCQTSTSETIDLVSITLITDGAKNSLTQSKGRFTKQQYSSLTLRAKDRLECTCTFRRCAFTACNCMVYRIFHMLRRLSGLVAYSRR